jgi:uncharacterized protein DUF3618
VDEAARTGRPQLDNAKRSPEQIRADIEHTREELGETVEALAAKTDIKAQARSKVDETKQRARDTVEQVRDKVAPAGNGSGPASAPDPSDLRRRVRRAAADDPVAVRVLCAFAAGLLAGLLVKRR